MKKTFFTILAIPIFLMGCTDNDSKDIAKTPTDNPDIVKEVSVSEGLDDTNTITEIDVELLETSNWMTFNYDLYGFTFKYPSSYFLQEVRENQVNISERENDQRNNDVGLSIYLDKALGNEEQEWIKSDLTRIDSNGVVYYLDVGATQGQEYGRSVKAIINNGENVLNIQMGGQGYSVSDEGRVFFHTLLSTVKVQ